LCVQHIAGEFAKGLVSWLAEQSKLTINFARAGESFQRGTITFPAPGCNLHVGPAGLIAMSPLGADTMGASVDVTMKSAAQYWGAGTVGVLLTGMGSDGAQGMLAISQARGVTIAQNAETSVIFGMPERAIALGAAQSILPLCEIAPALIRLAAPTHG